MAQSCWPKSRPSKDQAWSNTASSTEELLRGVHNVLYIPAKLASRPSIQRKGNISEAPSNLDMENTSLLYYSLASSAILWICYLLGLVIYRLYFHPLAAFPGPKYAAISRWHEFYYEVVKQGQFTFEVQKLHKRYGT
jgi:hypothetical protein